MLDTRVLWSSEVYDFFGKKVLELGPLEGYHSKHLCERGADVLAVEASDVSYLKCLIAKEILQIPAKFLYGDASAFLQQANQRFDFIWASGILYHQKDPLEFLDLVCDHCDAFFIWTHYWSEGKVEEGLHFDPGKNVVKAVDDLSIVYHYHSYESRNASFSGGIEEFSVWMERDDILRFIAKKGFVISCEINHSNAYPGPIMQFVAQRR